MLAGVDLRKERRLSDVLTDSINILIAHWRPLAIIALPVVVANIAFSLIIMAISQDFPTAEEINNGTAEMTAEELGRFIVLVGLTLFFAVPILFVLQQLVTGGAVVYLDETDRGHPITPAEALDSAQAALGRLVGATLRAAVIILLLAITIAGIPFAINRAVRWIFLAQVIMLEGKAGPGVLARSAELVKGRWWNTLGRLIVVGLVIGIPIGILQGALAGAWPGVGGNILSTATGFISVPFGIIALSLMYFHLRARKEEDDITTRPGAEPAP